MATPSDDVVRAFFDEVGVRRRFPSNSYLFHDGDQASSVYLVETGMLTISRTTVRGRQVLLDVAMPGDIVGELAVIDDAPRSGTAATVAESRVSVVPAVEFRARVHSDVAFSNRILASAVQRLRELSDQYVEVAGANAAARIASRILTLAEVADHSDEPFDVDMPFSQEALGQWAGLSREGAVHGLAELRSAGLIETGRRRIRVFDLDGLQRLVGGRPIGDPKRSPASRIILMP